MEYSEIHCRCHLHPRLVLLQYDHDSLGTLLQTRLSVTKETGAGCGATVFWVNPPHGPISDDCGECQLLFHLFI